MSSHLPDLADIRRLYDQHRFVDAYQATRPLWERPDLVPDLTIDQLILGGRLAGRLGGHKVRRWLFRRAIELDSADPQVSYFAHSTARPRWHLLDHLLHVEGRQNPFDDPALEASWLASHAQLLASVRDFDRAHELLARARELGNERAWVAVCESEVLLLQDRWTEAEAAIEPAWAASTGMPAAASVLGRILLKLGRLDEAVERLTEAARTGQSYEVLLVAMWYQCALAERSSEIERRRIARTSYDLSGTLASLTPLADRDTLFQLSACRLDAAWLMGDRELARQHAEELPSPYFRMMLANLKATPHGRQILLPFRAVYQKHQTCLPASIAAVAGSFEAELDEDDLAHALTYSGTAVWRVIDWLRERGFMTRPFVVTPDLARTAIEAGLPFIYMTESLSSAHAAAAVGLDEAGGTLVIHDPAEERWARILIDRLHEEEAPFGPQALAMVPPERAELLDVIPDSAAEPYAAHIRFEKTLELRGARAAGEVVEAFARRDPENPFVRRLQALHAGIMGNTYAAIQIQEALLGDFPDCLPLRRELLGSLHRTRNTARIRETLEGIVERRIHPGIRENQTWWQPPATYVAQYADYIGVTQQHFAKAERLLWSALGYAPFAPELYHVLGDVYARQERFGDSVLPYRVAANLEGQDDHYSRAACDALRIQGRESEGLALLEARVERLGPLLKGGGAWIAWIDALEQYGQPDEAIEAMRSAQSERSDDAPLHSWATQFWIRMGRWEEAEESLSRVENADHRGLYLEAAVRFFLVRGKWEQALELCQEWILEAPDNIDACRQFLYLLARRDGRRATLEQARQWASERVGHDEFEILLREELDRSFLRDEAESLIRARLGRNPLDAWAWRELGHILVDALELLPADARGPALAEVEEVLGHCQRLSPESAATIVLEAQVAASRGERESAVELLMQALSIDPDAPFGYNRVWDLTETYTPEAQLEVLKRLERRMFRTVGALHCARELAFRVAQRFGVREAEQVVMRWRNRAPDDPELVEAQVDLLLQYGQGRSDAQRAIELLEPAIDRFPNHFDLRFSLAHAHSILLREDEEISVLEEIIRREPLNGVARKNLARVLARRDDLEKALRVLDDGVRCDPLDAEVWEAQSRLLWDFGRYHDAIDALTRALDRLDENISLRELLVIQLQDVGDHDRAVEVAQAGVARFPDGAYCHLLLGEALHRSERHTDMGEIEGCYRRALDLNRELFPAADSLAVLLCSQQRFEEARALMDEQAGLQVDPSVAHGRLAWITRQQGDEKQALQELVEVVGRWPLYHWAWWLLMDWCEEDEAWKVVREVFGDIPPAMLDNPSFCGRRLMLLQAAGSSADELDTDWDKLLDDYPDHEEIHLRRLDLLIEREQPDRAAEVLEAIQRFHPHSSLVLARRVQLATLQERFEDALETSRALWQLPGDGEVWPEEASWHSLCSAGMTDDAVTAAEQIVLQGRRIRRRVFELMAQEIGGQTERYSPLSIQMGRGRAPVRRLLALLDVLEHAEWDTGHCLAASLERLHEIGATRATLRFWRRNTELCRRTTPVWQRMSYILSGDDPANLTHLREWLSDWREHSGVEMWPLANYTISLRKIPGLRSLPEDLDELHATSRDALEQLPHDATVRYHACVLCETVLRQGHDDEFIDLVDRWESLLRDTDERLWMWNRMRWAADVVLLFRDLLRSEGAAEAMALSRQLARSIDATAMPWVTKLWNRHVAERLSTMQRLRVRIMLLFARQKR